MLAQNKAWFAALILSSLGCSSNRPQLEQPVGLVTSTSGTAETGDVGAPTEAPAPAPTAQGPCAEPLPSFLFPPDSAAVSPAQNDELRRLASCLSIGSRRAQLVIAVGHTNEIGDSRYNLELGLERALKVKSFLVAHDVDEARVIATSAGELSTATNRPGRRVDLFLASSPIDVRRGGARIAPFAPEPSNDR